MYRILTTDVLSLLLISIEAATADLFANSVFSGSDWDTKIARDIFWKRLCLGFIQRMLVLTLISLQMKLTFLAI